MCGCAGSEQLWQVSPGSRPTGGAKRTYDGSVIKLVGTIQPVETKSIRADGETYEDAREALDAQVPEGWRLISIINER